MTTYQTQAAKDSDVSSKNSSLQAVQEHKELTDNALRGAQAAFATAGIVLAASGNAKLTADALAATAALAKSSAVTAAAAAVTAEGVAIGRAAVAAEAASAARAAWLLAVGAAALFEFGNPIADAAVVDASIAWRAAAAAATIATALAATATAEVATTAAAVGAADIALTAATTAKITADLNFGRAGIAQTAASTALAAALYEDNKAGDALKAAQAAYDDAVNGTVLCFAAGTLIRTPSGNRPVEELQIGDLVLTPDGQLPLKFLGISTRHVNNLKATGRMPIRIQAGVFGDSLPSADIYCTPSHAFALGECLVEAQALINGQSIYQLEELSEYDRLSQGEQGSPLAEHKEADSFTYYSLEFNQHVLVWANDLLTESYLPTYRDGVLTRVAWNNYDNYLSLYGSSETMNELPMPRIPFSRQLPLRIREQFGLLSSYHPSSAGISGSSPGSSCASRDELCFTL